VVKIKKIKTLVMKDQEPLSFSMRARLRSFRYAFDGITTFFATQHNAIIHLLATLTAYGAAIFFKVSKLEMVAITIAAGFVWAAELFNTAIEKLADMISKDFDERIEFIKNVSAAAVLLASVVALITGMIIFIPKLL
jgi:diacylglycerol kinase